jgi:hypothetical protein
MQQGLDQSVGLSFIVRAEDKQIGLLVPGTQILLEARQSYRLSHTEICDETLQVAALGPLPKYRESCLRLLTVKASKGVDEAIKPFLHSEPANSEEMQPLACGLTSGPPVPLAADRISPRVRNDVKFLGGHTQLLKLM